MENIRQGSKFFRNIFLKAKYEIEKLRYFKIKHISRNLNESTDLLLKMGNPYGRLSLKLLKSPIEELKIMEVDPEKKASWVDMVIEYLKTRTIIVKVKDPKQLKIKASHYILFDGELFINSTLMMYLRCVRENEVEDLLKEAHSGECGSHSG